MTQILRNPALRLLRPEAVKRPGSRLWRFGVGLFLILGNSAVLGLSDNSQLHIFETGAGTLMLAWPSVGGDSVLQETEQLNSESRWIPSPLVPSLQGGQFVVELPPTGASRFFRLLQTPPPDTAGLRLVSHLPANGATEVGVTFHPKISFSEPISPATCVGENFYATFAGVLLRATVVPANNGMFAWLFFNDPLPGGAQIQVTVEGSTILSAATGTPLDADGNGLAGGVRRYEFTTVRLDALGNTTLSGVVLDPGPDLLPHTADDVDPGPDGTFHTRDDVFLLPIAGVRVFLLGREALQATTGLDGAFRFDAVPTGNVKVAIDGMTASAAPPGFYFPEMVMDARMEVGIDNFVMPGMRALFLPRLPQTILENVSSEGPTMIVAGPEGAPDLSPQDRDRLRIEVPAHSLISADGSRLGFGQVGISTVPPELVRDMLPPGVLQHTFDITVQAPGIANFATPAPMTFPNVFGAPPGTQLNFLSFDHTTGRLVIEGTATVSADGLTVRTDPGVGVTHPGWHGLTPPGGENDPPCPPGFTHDTSLPPIPVANDIHDYFFIADGETLTLSFGNAAPKVVQNALPCDPSNLLSTPLRVEIDGEGPVIDFLENGIVPHFDLYPGQQRNVTISARRLLTPQFLRTATEDILYSARFRVRLKAGDAKGPVLLDKTISVFRFVDVTDLRHDDGTITFARTWVDGPDGVFQRKRLRLRLADQTVEDIRFSSPTPDFKLELGFSEVSLIFDPTTTTEKSVDLTVAGPQSDLVFMKLQGLPMPRQRILLNQPGFRQAIMKITDTAAQAPIDGTETFITKFFRDPTDDPNGRLVTSNDPLFEGRVGLLYDRVRRTTLDIFQQSDPPAAQALEFVDNNSDGMAINWEVLDPVNEPTISVTNSQSSIVGKTIGIHLRTNVVFVVYAEAVASNADVTLSLESSPTSTGPWGSLTNGIALRQTPAGRPTTFRFTAGANRFFRAVATHTGAGSASYDVFVLAAPVNTCNAASLLTPACAVWTDFAKGTYLTDLTQRSGQSLPESKLRMSWLANLFVDDRGPAGSTFSGVIMNLDVLVNAENMIGSIASALAHEIGHNLGAIHMRDRLHSYIGGDVMGSEGFRQGRPPKFTKLLPIIQFGLGLPVTDEQFRDIDAYYRRFLPLETFAFPAFPAPDHVEDTILDLPYLTVLKAMPELDGEVPDSVDSIMFQETFADGAEGNNALRTFVLFNSGDRDLRINAIQLVEAESGFAIVDNLATLPWILPPLDPADLQLEQSGRFVTVRFDPERAGSAAARIVIESNSLDGEQTEILLSGVAISPAANLEASVPNSNLGGVDIAMVAQRTRFATLINNGSQPLVISSIQTAPGRGEGEFLPTGLPPTLAAGQTETLPPGGILEFDLAFTPSQFGLRRGTIHIHSNDPDTPIFSIWVLGTGLAPANEALDYGGDFVAFETPDVQGLRPLRTVTDEQGNFSFFLPPEQPYHGVVFDPVSGLLAHLNGVTAPSGRNTTLGVPLFLASTEPDLDGDGLPDDAEFAIGTDPTKADTDGDGVDDFAEVAQGLDPLGGRGLPLGIIGRSAFVGEAREVVVLPVDDDPNQQHAYVAGWNGGLVIMDVSQFDRPVMLSRTEMPGLMVDVDVDPSRAIAAAVVYRTQTVQGGLHLIDIFDPVEPRLIQTVRTDRELGRVVVLDGIAYVTEQFGTRVTAFDLKTGATLQILNLGGSDSTDIATDGERLFVMDRLSNLFVVTLSNGDMIQRGQINVPETGGNIFVGRDIVYAAARNGRGSVATINMADPDAPLLLSVSDVPQTSIAPRSAFALNGSGLGILVGLARNSELELETGVMDVLDATTPSDTYEFLTRIALEGIPYGVDVAGGMAFVAAGEAGLLIVNYSALDSQGQPPSASLDSKPADVDPVTPGVQVVEGESFSVNAELFDDFQVREVELIVDGRVAHRSLSFPFRLRGVAPNIAQTGGTFTVRIRATDTGGNTALSEPVEFHLLPDVTPPGLLSVDPEDGARRPRGLKTVQISFSEPIGQAGISAQNFQLLDAHGVAVVGITLRQNVKKGVVELELPRLLPAEYTLKLRQIDITDAAGNALGQVDWTSRFTIEPHSIRWIATELPPPNMFWSWHNPRHWSPQRVPEPDDDVLIDVPDIEQRIILQHPDLSRNGPPLQVHLNSLICRETLYLGYIDFQWADAFFLDGLLISEGGAGAAGDLYGKASTLRDSLLIGGLAARLAGTPIAENMKLSGEFLGFGLLSSGGQFSGGFFARNRFTLDGIMRAGALFFYEDAEVAGAAEFLDVNLVLGAPAALESPRGPIVTLGSTVLVHGRFDHSFDNQNTTLINEGRIASDTPHPNSGRGISSFRFFGNSNHQIINRGTIEVRNGSRLWIRPNEDTSRLVNEGILQSIEDGHLIVTTRLQTERIFCDATSNVSLETSVVENAPDQTTTLAGPGRWLSSFTTLQGGTVRMAEGATLEGTVWFDNVTFEGELHHYDFRTRDELQKPQFSNYGLDQRILSDLTLHGRIVLHDDGRMLFPPGDHVVQGRGTIEFLSDSTLNWMGRLPTSRNHDPLTITIGSEITLGAKRLIFGDNPTALPLSRPPVITNQGTIAADFDSAVITVNAQEFFNAGKVTIGRSSLFNVDRGLFTQLPDGNLGIEVAGTAPSLSHGQLMVRGGVSLNGRLAVTLRDGFQPSKDDEFNLVTGGVVVGPFAAIDAPDLENDLEWRAHYEPSRFVLRATDANEPPPPVTVGRGALALGVTSGYVHVEHAEGLNTFPMTVTAWIKTSRTAPLIDGIVSKYVESSLNGFSLFLYNGRIRAWYFRDTGNYVWDGGLGLDGGMVADDQWHHVALTIDTTSGRLYLDGALTASRDWFGSAGAPTTTTPLQFGRYDHYANRFTGQIEEFTIWNEALPEGVLRDSRFQRRAGTETNLIGYWRFDEAGGSTTADHTGHGHEGLLISSPTWVSSTAPILE